MGQGYRVDDTIASTTSSKHSSLSSPADASPHSPAYLAPAPPPLPVPALFPPNPHRISSMMLLSALSMCQASQCWHWQNTAPRAHATGFTRRAERPPAGGGGCRGRGRGAVVGTGDPHTQSQALNKRYIVLFRFLLLLWSSLSQHMT